MGFLILILGLLFMVGGAAAPPEYLDGAAKFIVIGFGFLVFVGGAVLSAATTFYRKTSADQAFVRTGMGRAKVVLDGGIAVFPAFHNVLDVNLQTMKLFVTRSGRNALITRDNLRADVLAQFYIKVQPTQEHILMAARSLGENSVNTESVEKLVSEKLVSALRAIAATMDLFDIHAKRDEFAEKVHESVRSDLEANGLLLESVTISELDQTDMGDLTDSNVFDAQGKRKITEITAGALVERNRIEREAERLRTEKDVETRQQVLALERMQAEAEANQMAEIAKVRASKEQEAQEAEIHREQAVAQARVGQEQAVKESEIARDLAVQAANINRERQLIQREQEQQQTDIERVKAVELAERQKQIAVAEKETERAKAEEGAFLASAERERASQQVTTVSELAEADREAQKKLIAAKQEIERNKIAEQTQAEVQAYTRVKQAEAEQESATKQAAARMRMAEAESESRKLVAEGEAAQQMVPVQVERERVNVKSAEVAVEAQSLENRQKFAAAGIELEVQRLRIQADKEIQVAMAEAIGKSLSSAKMTLFGSPEMASNMLSNLSKGMGVRTAIEGFTMANGNGQEDGMGGGPLDGLMDILAPIVERFSGNGADTEAIKAAVAEALAERDRTARVSTETQPPIKTVVPAVAHKGKTEQSAKTD